MTFFNTLYFLNDEISSFSFFRFEPPPSYLYYYQVNASWFYGIFETGLNFDNIFATVDLTEIFHSGLIWS